jgi:hypothetical protein
MKQYRLLFRAQIRLLNIAVYFLETGRPRKQASIPGKDRGHPFKSVHDHTLLSNMIGCHFHCIKAAGACN